MSLQTPLGRPACVVIAALLCAGAFGQNVPSSPQIRYIPHIVSGGGFVTKVTIANLASAPNNVTINFISQSGALLSSTQSTLAPAATLRIATPETDRFGPFQTKWAIVGSDQTVGINLFFEVNGGGGSTNIINTVGFNDVAAALSFTVPVEFLPAQGASIGRTVGLALANPSGVANTATLTLIDSNGATLATTTLSVGGFGQTSVDLRSLPAFSAVLPASDFVGTLHVSGTSAFSAIALGDDFGPFFSTPPVVLGRTGQLIVPHIVSGGGYVTKLTFMNLSSSSNSLDVRFFDQSGNLLQEQVINLAANGTARISSPESDRFGLSQTKWGIVTAPNPAVVNLFFEIENDPNTRAIINTVGFNDVVPTTDFSIPVEFMPTPAGASIGRTVGLALANPSSAATARVTIQVVDSNGLPVAVQTFSIPPLGQVSIDLSTLPAFQFVLPSTDFVGTAAIHSDQPIAAIALGDDLGPFFSIPAFGPSPIAPSNITVSITPVAPALTTGSSQQFSAAINGVANSSVIWSVSGVVGGNASVGTISPSGLYTAPLNLPASTRFTVNAISQVTPSAGGSAVVLVVPGASPAPGIASVTPNIGPVAGGTTITIAGSNFNSGATVTIGGLNAITVIFVTSSQLTAVTPPHAAGAVTVQVTNPDSQSGSLTNGFTYIPTPTVSSVAPAAGSTAGGTAITINGSGFVSGANVTLGGVPANNIVVVSGTQITATTPPNAVGTADLQVTNPGGLVGTLARGFTFVSPPTIATVTPNSGPATGGTVITINGTGFQPGATVAVGGVAATSVTVISQTLISATSPPGAPGTVDVKVTNPDTQSATLTAGFTYQAGPTVSSVSPNSVSSSGGTPVTITGANFQSGATVTLAGVPATGVVVVSPTRITAITGAGTVGTGAVRVTNPDGQVGVLPNSFTFQISFSQSTAPSIASISPSSGGVSGGTSVFINGSNFQPGITVKFGSVTATQVFLNTGAQIVVTTPAGASAGSVNVTVTNVDGQSATAVGGFTYLGLSISSISPTVVSTIGGTLVTITGAQFAPGIQVFFGGVAATSTTFVSSTIVQAVAPPHINGLVDVTVKNLDGSTFTLVGAASYGPPPTITNLTRNAGSSNGGTSTTINGTGFVPGTTVTFGGTSAASVTFVSSTQLTAVTPGHASGFADVTVTLPAGNFFTLPNGFDFEPAANTFYFNETFENGSMGLLAPVDDQAGSSLLPVVQSTFAPPGSTKAVRTACIGPSNCSASRLDFAWCNGEGLANGNVQPCNPAAANPNGVYIRFWLMLDQAAVTACSSNQCKLHLARYQPGVPCQPGTLTNCPWDQTGVGPALGSNPPNNLASFPDSGLVSGFGLVPPVPIIAGVWYEIEFHFVRNTVTHVGTYTMFVNGVLDARYSDPAIGSDDLSGATKQTTQVGVVVSEAGAAAFNVYVGVASAADGWIGP